MFDKMLTQFQTFAQLLEIFSQTDVIKRRQTSLYKRYSIQLSKKHHNGYVRVEVSISIDKRSVESQV